MLNIPCPYCGTRDQSEFSHHGEAHIVRPLKSDTLSDTQWGDYVFFRKNTKGDYAELWMHRHGCRKFFHMLRNTVTDDILGTCVIGASNADNIAKIIKNDKKAQSDAVKTKKTGGKK